MICTPLPDVTLRDLALANLDSVNRSPGLHVTTVIYEGIMPSVDPGRFGAGKKAYAEADSENWQETGFLWEEMMSAVFKRRAQERISAGQQEHVRFRPGEVTKDAIILSPDALVFGLDDYPDLPASGMVLEEYKATYKSSRSFDLYDKRYLGWLLQIKAYCVAVGTTEARLYVWHVNGSYEGYIPEVKAHRLQFTAGELADTWRQILNTAKYKGWLPA